MASGPAKSPAAPVGAGRGLVFITCAKLWFMVMGYVVQFALPRALGSPAKFGIWVLVLAVISPVNNVTVTATIRDVSKFASESDGRAGAVTRAALKLQAMIGGGTALLFVLAAPAIAWFERDSSLVPDLRLAAGIVLAYSLYAVFVGAANGARHFHKQAGLDMMFATLRTVLVVGAAMAFRTAFAAIGGFVTAAVIILFIAMAWVGFGEAPARKFPLRTLARYFGGVAAYLLIINLLMFVDGLLLKRLVAEHAAQLGAAHPAAIANAQEGFYGAVQAVARIPYQLILAVTFVIFPLVSKATFEADAQKTRGYVQTTMRYSLLVAALFAVTLGARPDAILRLFYKPEYAVGAIALGPLLVGYVCFSLFGISGTIINGAGRTLAPFIIGALTLATSIATTWIAIAFALGTGRDPLLWAALATMATMAVGLLLFGIYLRSSFGAFVSPLTCARTALAVLAALAVGHAWPTHGILGGKIGTLFSSAAVGLAFIAISIASGELRPKQLLAMRKKA